MPTLKQLLEQEGLEISQIPLGSKFEVIPFKGTSIATVRQVKRNDGSMALDRFTDSKSIYPAYCEVIDPDKSDIFLRIRHQNS